MGDTSNNYLKISEERISFEALILAKGFSTNMSELLDNAKKIREFIKGC